MDLARKDHGEAAGKAASSSGKYSSWKKDRLAVGDRLAIGTPAEKNSTGPPLTHDTDSAVGHELVHQVLDHSSNTTDVLRVSVVYKNKNERPACSGHGVLVDV